MARRASRILLIVLAGCAAHGDGEGKSPASNGHTEQRTVVEKTAHGTRTTVTTTTTETVEAPSPPARPADPYPSDPLVKYNVDLLNEYRAKTGAAPLLYDDRVSAFALAGSKQLSNDHKPHAHFVASAKGAPGFGPRAAENQGDPAGVPPFDRERIASGKKQIAIMLKMMFDEGPGGGHYDNMVNAKYRRIGIGLYETAGTLYLTNDFSD